MSSNNEEIYASKRHYTENLPAGSTQFSKIKFNGLTLRTTKANNCVFINNEIHIIRNIIYDGASYLLKVSRFRRKQNFYDVGMSSMKLGVYVVSELAESTHLYQLNAVQNKCFYVPCARVYKHDDTSSIDSSDDSEYEDYNDS